MPNTNLQRLLDARNQQTEANQRNFADIDARVEEITTLRGELESKLGEFKLACSRLEHSVRLASTTDPSTSSYRAYITMNQRLLGAIGQALQRSRGNDRLLKIAKEDREEHRRQEVEVKDRLRRQEAARQVQRLAAPKDDDFEYLYGRANLVPYREANTDA